MSAMTAVIAKNPLAFPETKRGRRSADQDRVYRSKLEAWATAIKEIQSRLDMSVSSRGWCYLLEDHGLSKADFDQAQTLINDLRKSGLLPLNICADDSSRQFYGIEYLDNSEIDEELSSIWNTVEHFLTDYKPVSFWENQRYFVQIVVEKIDLRNLFQPICDQYRIPIANARGWSDLNMRADMMRRFAKHEADGRIPVLLYCGDHDPKGLQISASLRNNLSELSDAVGWKPDNLIIHRFGLNADFIKKHNLTWIENLITGSGGDLASPKHKDHKQAYVQNYLAEFGAKKVEANALVTRPKEGRALCEAAILKYVQTDKIPEFESRLELARTALQQAFKTDVDARFKQEAAP